LCGELVDSALFYFIAFYGVWTVEQLLAVTMTQYVLKTSWEVVMTPVTYKLVNKLKQVEHQDHFDLHTNFTPFTLKT
jgi:hypothetical protein